MAVVGANSTSRVSSSLKASPNDEQGIAEMRVFISI